MSTNCFHCGLPVPDGSHITIRYQNEDKAMCCHGCEAVANAIIGSGMDDFYRFRTATPDKPEELVPDFLQQLSAYDNPQVQKHFVSQSQQGSDHNADIREVSLILEGIVCAACVWLNEKHLLALDGVVSVSINYSTHRARVRWDNQRIQLSQILESISQIGYLAHPFDPDKQQKLIESERKQQLRRIGLAGVLGMQIMIFAVAMYTGDWWGMDPGFKQSFRWISLLLTIPVLIFTSSVFFRAAWRDLGNARVGMDVPVSLGIGIAFIASVYHTIINQGEVYFDSVVMFTFFLLTARYFEFTARKRTAEATESLLNLRPAVATRIVTENGKETQQSIAVSELHIGDHILVRPGEHIPADGCILQGTSGVNESLLTGESMPLTRSVGDKVIGGSINTENALLIRVEKLGDDTVLSSIQNLLEKAQNTKPRIARLADRVASWFVSIILSIAAGVAVYWYLHDPEQWISITVATLVVTCPCALSLATPAAITAASGQLAKIGLLPKNTHALETLATVSDFVFDKTGTLTCGQLQLKQIQTLKQLENKQHGTVDEKAAFDVNTDDNENLHHYFLQIAASLEAVSEHPVAHCIVQASKQPLLPVSQPHNTPGYGVEGIVTDNDAKQTHWYIGNADYIKQNCELDQQQADSVLNAYRDKSFTIIFLATRNNLHAVFLLEDQLRPQSAGLIHQLQKTGQNIHLMSGDNQATTEKIATTLGIQNTYANMRPQDKLNGLRRLQDENKIVAMTGDGINDAPVLAAANLSIAMGKGSQLAIATADMVLLSSNVLNIFYGYRIARQCINIIRQNLFWAIAYNIIAVPAAAMGYIEPWLAAIGMSASSLIVVLNALRLTRGNKQ